MKYYKVIHKETGKIMCYVSGDATDAVGDVIRIIGEEEYGYIEISKEEFERETGEGETDA